MAKTLAQIERQIDALQKEADDIKRKEIPGVISRIKEAIRHYGLSASDLGFAVTGPKAPRVSGRSGGKDSAYSDGAGNVWSGRGPRPAWLRAALAEGKALSDFATGGGGAVSGGRKAKAAKTSKAKYSNGAGKTWSGRGPRPGWVKEALGQGKQLADLLV